MKSGSSHKTWPTPAMGDRSMCVFVKTRDASKMIYASHCCTEKKFWNGRPQHDAMYVFIAQWQLTRRRSQGVDDPNKKHQSMTPCCAIQITGWRHWLTETAVDSLTCVDFDVKYNTRWCVIYRRHKFGTCASICVRRRTYGNTHTKTLLAL